MTSTKPANIDAWYEELISAGKINPDARQKEAVAILHDFANKLSTTSNSTSSFRFSPARFFSSAFFSAGKKSSPATGVYLYGKVGRGKTLLMDGFFLTLPLQKKKRVHFHSFIRHFHDEMQAYSKIVDEVDGGSAHKLGKELGNKSGDRDTNKNSHKNPSRNSSKKHAKATDDALVKVAKDLAAECDVLCFDEFHISDIADAMIMSRLLEQLLALGVSFVMTSNYHPQELYPNGLARHLFVPAINLIMQRFTVFAVDGDDDYRQLSLRDGDVYFYPLDDTTNNKMTELFDRIACGINLTAQVVLQGRQVEAVRRSSDAVWFDFATLCQGDRSQVDYLRLADRFGMVFLSAVPQLNKPQLADAARRFTWLVDILYDRKIGLVISAAVPTQQLYGGGGSGESGGGGAGSGGGGEFGAGGESGRTLSRLTEMQSSAYLQSSIK